jgi:hypothetical protein
MHRIEKVLNVEFDVADRRPTGQQPFRPGRQQDHSQARCAASFSACAAPTTIASLSAKKRRGVISAGNHAQGVACRPAGLGRDRHADLNAGHQDRRPLARRRSRAAWRLLRRSLRHAVELEKTES